MTEFCFPSTISNKNESNNTNKSSDFAILCSYIISHPLYFSYFIFFSPYLIRLLSLLYPLFLTTFLLVLSLVTTLIPLRSMINSKHSFFLAAYTTLVENFRPSFDDDHDDENLAAIEEFEVYRIVFDIPTIELIVANPDEDSKFGENPVDKMCQLDEKPVDQCENLTLGSETGDTNPKKFEDEKEKKQELMLENVGSEVNEVRKTPKSTSLKAETDEKFYEALQQTGGVQQNIASLGSMRKEKEWRRTLACKLFEERHNWSNNDINVSGVNDEEGMDLLWETDETEVNEGKLQLQVEVKVKDGKKQEGRKRREEKREEMMRIEKGEESEEYEEYETGKICCLQALKLSAGKMNLSVGRPNLVKISKVFKGIGWLHSHVKRKGNNNNNSKVKGCK